MAEKTTKKYSIKELWDMYMVACDFREKAAYAVREQTATQDRVLPSVSARFNFYNRMASALEDKLHRQMEEIANEIL